MKLIIAILLAVDLVAGTTAWVNEAKKSKCTNPFFTKGFTVYMDGKAYEVGFRDDGLMAWRHPL